MTRLISALCAAVALQAATALAAPTPSPAPALSGILAAPLTNDFTEASASNTTLLEGEFDSKAFVTKTNATNSDAVQQTMSRDGFIDGYWRTWVQRGTQHVMVEIVMAFTGGEGAKRWLGSSELADKADASYKSAMTITGIDPYYGAKFLYANNNSHGAEFVFVKGNDMFAVIFVSPKDDLDTVTASQAKAQYSSAPDATVPKSQWPETASSNQTAIASATISPQTIFFFLVIAAVIVGVVMFFVTRSRRRPALGAVPGEMAGAMPATAVPSAMPATAVQMSPDGGYWWDGQSWRDAQREAPPFAQRSPDGHFWWDGRQWRAVP